MSLKLLDPPWTYLSSASAASLQSFELSRLNHAANLRREIGTLLDQWLEETTQAMLARWLLNHPELMRAERPHLAGTIESASPVSASGVPLPEFQLPEVRPRLVRQVKPRPRAANEDG